MHYKYINFEGENHDKILLTISIWIRIQQFKNKCQESDPVKYLLDPQHCLSELLHKSLSVHPQHTCQQLPEDGQHNPPDLLFVHLK